MDFATLESGELALFSPEPMIDYHDLTAREKEEALLRWRQVEMVVREPRGFQWQSRAIYRLAGEEDVHSIDDAETVEREISFGRRLEVPQRGGEGVPASLGDVHGDAREWVEVLEVIV